jgi:hypothetical protein
MVQRRAPATRNTDSHALLFDSSNTGNTMQTYQYRIGGRYFPAAPVQMSTAIGNSVNNGATEAYVELEKALNIVGDYRLSSGVNAVKWAPSVYSAGVSIGAIAGTAGLTTTTFAETDYLASAANWTANGSITPISGSIPGPAASSNSFAGNMGSACFSAAVSLETSNGLEISGLNAEEQSDISLIANWSAAQNQSFNLEVYSLYDAMIILRENNVILSLYRS